MNKNFKKILKYILLSFFAFIALKVLIFELHIFFPKIDPNVQYDIYGQDKYTYFGDARFQVMNWPTDMEKLELIDFASGYMEFVVYEVDKYILVGKTLYVSGDFSKGTATDEYGKDSHFGSVDPSTGQFVYYRSYEEIPNFMTLDTQTGEAQYYTSQEMMSEEEQAIFNTDLRGNSCLKDRTCYEKGVNPPWWEFFTLWWEYRPMI